MSRGLPQAETHFSSRVGWLRAAVLGANDGIVSTASLVVGVAAASSGKTAILVAGAAGLVSGAMSMAAGEYVSVSAQADTEKADLSRERQELAEDYPHELSELADIYHARGLAPDLARQVAEQLMKRDALGAHTRDELGLSEDTAARPLQAALASAVTFSVGAFLPLLAVLVSPSSAVVPVVVVSTLVFLTGLGAAGAMAGGAGVALPVMRVTFWGGLAMAVTAGVGRLIGTVI
nr:VIT family protein [Brevundimonas diminuta]